MASLKVLRTVKIGLGVALLVEKVKLELECLLAHITLSIRPFAWLYNLLAVLQGVP